MFDSPSQWTSFSPLFQDLQEHWESIRDEALHCFPLSQTHQWPEKNLHNGKWLVHGVYWQGQECPGAQKNAPLTFSLLQHWTPSVYNAGFSIMLPGCEISPHVGYTKDVVRVHLGLVSPNNPQECAIQVGEQVRSWTPGELLIFDDTQLHSTWNRTEQMRLILLLDILRHR